MARRNGDTWFVGAMANNDGDNVEIDLSFLNPGTSYNATIYTDGGEKVKTATHVRIDSKKVSASDRLKFSLMPRGGAAIRIEPAKKR